MKGWLDLVTVVNRVKRPLTITYDGATVTVPALGSVKVPPIVADRGIQQNPQLGTEDPYNPADFQSLLGVQEWGDRFPCEPLEKEPDAIERIDRSQLPDDLQAVQVRQRRGKITPDRTIGHANVDVVFDGR